MISKKRRLILLLAATSPLNPALAWADNATERYTLHLGVVNERANQPDYVLAQYAPLLDYLRRQLNPKGIAVGELRIAKDIAELAGLIRTGKVDFILESMLSTFRINASRILVEPSLAAWRKGRRETSTVFFVRQSSHIKQLRDLAGRTLALESPRSTTAYALPKIVLRQHGLVVEPVSASNGGSKSVRYVLADSEANQAYWVDRGRADAGAFNSGDWEQLPTGLRQGLRIIHTTETILRWLMSVRTQLQPSVLQPLETALLEMHSSTEGIMALQQAENISRFDRLNGEDLLSLQNWRAIATPLRFGE
ncbi:phosphate/phosphite/phosphonate ABC transporter substrate-binding protein [Propionivibrio sp.]|uniref:phosphate/phosphite/phosphonate ABC transporter substrate-binding protein n=1 Tax=Propionivibrio sp. TaxID=2212460 RepID=UPI003BEFEFB2